MSYVKIQQISKMKQSLNFPKVTMSPLAQINQPQQKIAIQMKQSDFIKRIKRTKSIMLAQKNRKQKHILNSYFMYSPRKKNKYLQQLNKSQSSILTTKKSKDMSQQQKLQLNLLPPVHSSILMSLKQNKKSKEKLTKNQLSYCEYLNLNNKKINGYVLNAVKQKNDLEQAKILSHQLDKIVSQREKIHLHCKKIQSQLYNYSAVKLHQRQSCYFKQKVKKKFSQRYRINTQQLQLPKKQQDKLSRWQFNRFQDEHYQTIQQNNF